MAELYRRVKGAVAIEPSVAVHNSIGGPEVEGHDYTVPRYTRCPAPQARILEELSSWKKQLVRCAPSTWVNT